MSLINVNVVSFVCSCLPGLPSCLTCFSVCRSCWVCFATDEDDRTAEWVRPCRCRGSTKWVHQACLQRWVDEKQRGNSTARVACPQCNAEYLIVFPKLGTAKTHPSILMLLLVWILHHCESSFASFCQSSWKVAQSLHIQRGSGSHWAIPTVLSWGFM